jgi:hypothetical protein
MKLNITGFLILFFLQSLRSQVAVSYFPFQSVLAISSNTERLLWADYKLETNTFAGNMDMELSPKLNFNRTEAVNYYTGPGVSFNPAYTFSDLTVLNGYFLDFGVRVKPFSRNRSFQVVFEISPYANKNFNGGSIRTRLGLGWNFNRVKKTTG